MPIFEYKCNQCDNLFEVLIFSANEKKQIICPKCGAKDSTKLMSSFACRDSSALSTGAGHSGSCGSSGKPFT